MFNEETIAAYLEELALPEVIHLEDIPDIELYMDQVIAFFDKKLSRLKRSEKDKLLTSTMINNYTKEEILLPPVKKRYSREHLAMLLLVYSLKQILSIRDIATLFNPLFEYLEEPGRGVEVVDQLYTLSTDAKQRVKPEQSLALQEEVQNIREHTRDLDCPEQEQVQWFLLVASLISQATLQKRLAEKIIDNHFKKKKSRSEE